MALIESAGLPGARSIWADPLHDGPVPADLTDRELMEVRARHLADGEHTLADVTAELERWRPMLQFVTDDWLKKAQERGLDGRKMLDDLQAMIKASSS